MVRVGASAVLCAAIAAVGAVRAAKCADYDTCAACTAAPDCGQCLLSPSVEGGVRVQEQRCVAGNETGPFDPNRVCDHWSVVSCARRCANAWAIALTAAARGAPGSCPLDCSLHGKCQEDGVCQCAPGWRGSGCSVESGVRRSPLRYPSARRGPQTGHPAPPQAHGKPGVLIPIALLCAVLLVGILVAAQVRPTTLRPCARARHPRRDPRRHPRAASQQLGPVLDVAPGASRTPAATARPAALLRRAPPPHAAGPTRRRKVVPKALPASRRG